MAIPVVGSIDYKWLIIGAILALFVWPKINAALRSKTTAAPTQTVNQ